AGTYEYRSTYTDDEGSETGTGRFTLESAKQQDGETRQTEVDVEDDVTTTTGYAWRSDGLYIRTITNDGATCDFEPDIMAVPSPPTAGRTWRTDTACTEEGETIRLTGTSRTVRTERMAVGGRQVEVVVIETTLSAEGTEFSGKQFFAPAHGIVVRDETTHDDGSSEVREVLNVDPK
ncbi:MAG: hypothetical protein M3394_09795, partial [Actinomycetota bacterium]|nr:hypothetical protein [Actinomycetota bacterium]